MSGGLVGEVGIHYVDIVRYLCRSEVAAVEALGSNQVLTPGNGVDTVDAAAWTMRMHNGVIASFAHTWAAFDWHAVVTLTTCSGIRFVGERIDVTIISDGSFHVAAAYEFSRDTSSTAEPRLFYPLPVDSVPSFPLDLAITCRDTPVRFAPHVEGRGVVFQVPFRSSARCTVHVSYTQSSANRHGCYILTTTQAWEAPLTWGDYFVRTNPGLQLTSLNWPADTVRHDDGSYEYSFRKREFMPDRDLEFSWQELPE